MKKLMIGTVLTAILLRAGTLKQTEAAVIKQLNYSWKVKTLQTVNGNMNIVLADRQVVTTAQFTTMISMVCYVLDENKASSSFKSIKITNLHVASGFVFEAPSSCNKVINAKGNQANILIAMKTHSLLDSERIRVAP